MNQLQRFFSGLLFLCAFCLAATGHADIPLAQVSADLTQRLFTEPPPARLHAGGAALSSPAAIARFYARRDHRPAWLQAAGVSPQAGALLAAINDAEREGLRARDYHVELLSVNLPAADARLARPTSWWTELELLLTDAYLTYGTHLLLGKLDPRDSKRKFLPARQQDLAALLAVALSANRVAESLSALIPSHPGYARLRQTLADYQRLAEAGGWPTVSGGVKLEQGMHHRRVRELRTRLASSGDLSIPVQPAAAPVTAATDMADPGFVRVANTAPVIADSYFDPMLTEAVKQFQRRHGLLVDGIVGPRTLAALNVPVTERIRQLQLNMERWRWLPEYLGQRYVMVNIPAFDLSVIEDGQPVLDMAVIVGRTDRPTPVFSANMRYLVMNPYWYVPRSIAVKDKLPKLREDAYALGAGMRIYDEQGNRVDPGEVDWHAVSSRNFSYRLQQSPGARNALGRIKFMFPNRHHVYLHDTPSRYLFKRTRRAYSSGCIRVAKPLELAEYLLKDDSRWSYEKIKARTRGNRKRTVNLPGEVPVYLLYWTAWVDPAGTIHFRDDIYNRDRALSRVLFPKTAANVVRLTAERGPA